MISSIGATKKNKGFTLVEILLVIIITAIILALAAPNFSKGYARFQLNKTADDLLSVSRWAQAMAIGQQRLYALVFAGDRRSYGLVCAPVNTPTDDPNDLEPVKGPLGRMHHLPDGIQAAGDIDRIRFYPDGSIDPVSIQLNSPGQKMVLSSSPVRGMMTKVDDE